MKFPRTTLYACTLVLVLPSVMSLPVTPSFVDHRYRHKPGARGRHKPDTRVNDGHHVSINETSEYANKNVSELKKTISVLEGYQHYYKHLLWRGYLSEDDTRRLEQLGQLLVQLKVTLISKEYTQK